MTATTPPPASEPAPITEAPPPAVAPADEEERHKPFELGMFGGLFVPSKQHSLVARGHSHEPYKSPAGELGARLSVLPLPYLGLEVEGAVMPTKTDSDLAGGLWAARGHVIGQLPLGRFIPLAVIGLGALGGASNSNGSDADLAWHFGLGAKVKLDDFIALRLDGRDTVAHKHRTSSSGTHYPEVILGLTFMIGPKKAPPPPAPEAPQDSDGDGKPDAEDKCPTEAADTVDGCPIKDSDGDHVLDPVDACPTEAGSPPCGCPPRDKDGDSVIDELDKCPDEPGPLKGCPDPDADHDGIPVPDDKCPNEPETKNGFDDADGCPDQVPEKVKRFTGVVKGIEFDKGKDTIRPVSKAVLDNALVILNEYPTMRIEISGHTDSDGSVELNTELSKKRAEAVKEYFVSKGVDAKRIETRGAGPTEPIADNKTAAGKQKNRRIEFKLIQ